MIKLERDRTAEKIHEGFRGQKRIDRVKALMKAKFLDGIELNSNYWKSRSHWKDTKDQLKIESFDKCAYCEANTSAVAHGDVEHFRPKSVYWWLAYCYDNYLFSCQICNQKYKVDEFPITAAEAMKPGRDIPATVTQADIDALAPFLSPDPFDDNAGLKMADFIKAVKKEKAGLVDPYMTDPEPFFKWVADEVKKEVAIAPRKNTVTAKRAFDAVTKYYGLNRAELLGLRWKTYRILKTYKLTLESPALQNDTDLLNETKQTVKEMMDASSQFAGMVRYFARDLWKLKLD